MLLERLLLDDGIEEVLTLFFLLDRPAVEAAGLREILPPFLVELGEDLELLLEISFRLCVGFVFRTFIGGRLDFDTRLVLR